MVLYFALQDHAGCFGDRIRAGSKKNLEIKFNHIEQCLKKSDLYNRLKKSFRRTAINVYNQKMNQSLLVASAFKINV